MIDPRIVAHRGWTRSHLENTREALAAAAAGGCAAVEFDVRRTRDGCWVVCHDASLQRLHGVTLSIADCEFVVLVGPSGCGKSTTLRMIAGLEEITDGEIRIGERVVNDVAPKDRDIAMVFQNYALYPNMSVYKNMAFGLMLRREHAGWDNPIGRLLSRERFRTARAERDAIRKRVEGTANMLGIKELLNRRPKSLSGGQRQRVAVGRAIVRNPKAFLFDEPLSNLDARLRVEMRAELKKLHRRFQTTTVYVTHDQEEAMTLGDRVVVMDQGVVQQCAAPLEIYDRPVNRFVAGFVGIPPMNFLNGRITEHAGGLHFEDGAVRLPLDVGMRAAMIPFAGREIVLGARPEHLRPATQPGGSALPVNVNGIETLGDKMDATVSSERQERIVCRVDARLDLKEGQNVDMQIDMDRVHFFESTGKGCNVSLPNGPA